MLIITRAMNNIQITTQRKKSIKSQNVRVR